jgi:hypothetical protein
LHGGLRLVRRIVRSSRQAAGFLDAFSQGNFDGIIDARGHDEMAQAMLALKRVQTRVGFEFTDAKRRAVEVEAQRQAEAVVAREVNDAVAAATQGDLTPRIPLEGKNEFFGSCAAASISCWTRSAAPSPKCGWRPTSSAPPATRSARPRRA